jgi:protein TonB
MTPTKTENSSAEVTATPLKRWMGYALATSIMLHLLAVIFIVAAGSGTRGDSETIGVLLKDIPLAPTARQNDPAPILKAPSLPKKPLSPPEVPPSEESARKSPPAPVPTSGGGPQKNNNVMATPLGLGLTYGYISSIAEGRTLREDIRNYYIELVEKINQEWWRQADGLKEPIRQDGIIELYLQRDGTVTSQRIFQGTGSREADQVLQDVIKKVSPLPPLPAAFAEKTFVVPLRIKAPSYLFRLNNRL